MLPKEADGKINNEQRLIWVCTVFPNLSVEKHRTVSFVQTQDQQVSNPTIVSDSSSICACLMLI